MEPFQSKFEFNILAFDPFLSEDQINQKGAQKSDLLELAKNSDFIAVLCNLDESTEGMINSDFFSEMKETGYILNLSRGPVINEKDLEHALENNLIAGAGLDVTAVEPLPDTSKLLDFKNVIIIFRDIKKSFTI